MRERKKT